MLRQNFVPVSSGENYAPESEPVHRDREVTGGPASHPLWVGIAMAALSAALLSLTMPAYFNAGAIGWIALVPLLLAFELFPKVNPDVFTLTFGLLWSLAVHNWYVSIFGPWGVLLLIGAGVWYSAVIGFGIRAQRLVPGGWKLLALPVMWSGLEFLKFIAPVVRDWWFVLFAKSQWGFPASLQVLSLTGFPGLSFLLMLANVAVAALLAPRIGRDPAAALDSTLDSTPDSAPGSAYGKSGADSHRVGPFAIGALGLVAATLLWGAYVIPNPPEDTFVVVATSDLANGPDIQQYSELPQAMEGYYADTPEMSQAIFDVNAELTRRAVAEGIVPPGRDVAFVVWPENEFADADDAFFMQQVGDLAEELGAYVVVDTVWRAPTGLHDAAVMIGPDGREVGRRAKVHLFQGEEQFGFQPGPVDGNGLPTPYGIVSLGVCYDYRYLDVVRALARGGADIMLMPTDDDMNANGVFPYYHATDGIFRAVEHRVAFAAAGVNGVSVVVDPYGRVTAMGGVNERDVIAGETFAVPGETLYTRWGDWFGWLMVTATLGFAGFAWRARR